MKVNVQKLVLCELFSVMIRIPTITVAVLSPEVSQLTIHLCIMEASECVLFDPQPAVWTHLNQVKWRSQNQVDRTHNRGPIS